MKDGIQPWNLKTLSEVKTDVKFCEKTSGDILRRKKLTVDDKNLMTVSNLKTVIKTRSCDQNFEDLRKLFDPSAEKAARWNIELKKRSERKLEDNRVESLENLEDENEEIKKVKKIERKMKIEVTKMPRSLKKPTFFSPNRNYKAGKKPETLNLASSSKTLSKFRKKKENFSTAKVEQLRSLFEVASPAKAQVSFSNIKITNPFVEGKQTGQPRLANRNECDETSTRLEARSKTGIGPANLARKN